MSLNREAALPSFFASRIDEARNNQGVSLSEIALGYLTGLLVRLTRAPEAFEPGGHLVLAELHLKALQSDEREAVSLYQKMGDSALFMTSFFAESLERKPVNFSYYTGMGGAAYHQVAGLTERRGGEALSEMFRELSHRFEDCVALLSEVADRDRTGNDRDLLRLYELWLTTRSPHAARRLSRLGFLPENQGTD